MDPPISSMMAKQPMTVDMDDTVGQVEDVLRLNNLSAVPVVERVNGSVMGIISARDLVGFHALKRDPAAIRAWEICTYRPAEVSPDAPVSEVARLMAGRGIHHVVVTENREVKGIVSALDFVRMFI